jgi:hypothetical protein
MSNFSNWLFKKAKLPEIDLSKLAGGVDINGTLEIEGARLFVRRIGKEGRRVLARALEEMGE